MTPLQAATVALYIAAAGAALLLTRRDPRHRPVAWYLCVVVAVDALRWGRSLLLPPAMGPREGWELVARHAEAGLYLASILALPALAWVVFGRSLQLRGMGDPPVAIASLWQQMWHHPSSPSDVRQPPIRPERQAVFVDEPSTRPDDVVDVQHPDAAVIRVASACDPMSVTVGRDRRPPRSAPWASPLHATDAVAGRPPPRIVLGIADAEASQRCPHVRRRHVATPLEVSEVGAHSLRRQREGSADGTGAAVQAPLIGRPIEDASDPGQLRRREHAQLNAHVSSVNRVTGRTAPEFCDAAATNSGSTMVTDGASVVKPADRAEKPNGAVGVFGYLHNGAISIVSQIRRCRFGPVLLAWLLLTSYLIADYPALSGAGLMRIYELVEVGAVVFSGLCFARWLSGPRLLREGLSPAVACTLALISGPAATVAAPWLVRGTTLEAWPGIVAANGVAVAITLVLQLHGLLRARRRLCSG